MNRRPGIALMIALVMLLLVEGMAAGMLALAMHTRLVAASQLRSASVDATARFAAETVLANWQGTGFDTLAQGAVLAPASGRGSAGDVSWSSTVERIAGSSFLLRAEAHAGGGHEFSAAHAVAIARTLDRNAVLRQFNAAITSAGPLLLAGQSRVAIETGELLPDSLCPLVPYLPEPAALLSNGLPVVSETVELAGPVVVDTSLALGAIALGNLSWTEVAQIADTIVSDVLLLAPDSSNPLIFANGDLTLSGTGQGILVVAGALAMVEEAAFTGMIVARDGLNVSQGSRIHGAVVSQADYAMVENATVTYSRCTLARITWLNPAADRPVLGRRRFIPVF